MSSIQGSQTPPPAPNPSSQPQTPAGGAAQASIQTAAGPQMVGNQAATSAGPQAFGRSQVSANAGPQSIHLSHSSSSGGDGGGD
jgi:hypothetical protein